MPSTYTTSNRLELQNPGENLNTWGSKLNSDTTALIDSGMSGVTTLTPSGPITLTTANGSADQSRAAIINCTSGTGGTLTIPAVSKVYQVRNNCSGSVLFTTGSGTVATVEAGSSATVICDGTNCYRFADAADIAAAQGAAEAYALSLSFAASGGQLPGQSGNAGNILSTNGSAALWTSLAPTATALATAQNFSLTGVVTASAISFNGTGGVALSTTIGAGAISSGMLAASVALTGVPTVPTAANGTNTTQAASTAFVLANAGVAPTTALFTQTQTQGSNASETSLTGSTYHVRALNTTNVNTIVGASLNSNQITLPAGTYEVFAQQAYAVNTGSNVQSRWQNITDSTTTLSSNVANTGQSNLVNSSASLQGQFTITGTKAFSLEIYSGVSGNGGTAANGGPEVYVSVYLRKIA